MTQISSQRPEGQGEAGPGHASLVRRIMRTLEILAVEPLTAAELGRRLDINRSTALRLMSELIETGYVTRDPHGKSFALVPNRFLNLVARQDQHTDWAQVVDPVLAEIRDETKDSTILGVPANQTMVYLAFFPTLHVVAVRERLGTVRPMHCSALGKAYLSALDDSTLDRELSLMSFTGGTTHAAGGPVELRERVMQARRDGYALDVDETFEYVRCVATPVRINGSLIGAVGISGPAERFGTPRMHRLGEYLKQRLSSLGS